MSNKLLIISLVGGFVLLILLGFMFLGKEREQQQEQIDEPDAQILDVIDVPTIIPEIKEDVVIETIDIEEEPVEEQKYSLFEEDNITFLNIEGVTIVFVTKEYALPSDYGGVNEESSNALQEMFSAAADEGIYLTLVSGYRSYDTQASIYSRYVSEWGQEYTDTVSARPGHSEHQTGLAFDINMLSNSFKNTKEYKWLQEYCADYGFIMRYPEGSEFATGYSFEPWHYRYIGDKDLARRIMESGLSLEEYIGLITAEDIDDEQE